MSHPRPRTSPLATAATAALALIAAVAAATATGGCASEPPPPFHENPVGVLPQNSLSRGWFVDLNLRGADHQVTVLDVRRDLLFVYTADKQVAAINRKSGTVQYTMAVSSPELALEPVVELAGYVVFPNATNLQVYDDHGAFLKAVPVPTPLRSHAASEGSDAPGVNRGTTIYFGAAGTGHGGLVEAYDISRRDAYKKWEYITHTQGAILAGPAVYGDIVYSGDDQGEVDAVSTSRVQVWDTDHQVFLTQGSIVADLKADESGLYVASTDSKLYCIDGSTGKLKWQYFAGAPLDQPAVLTRDTVYLMTPNHGLVAVDKGVPANHAPIAYNAAPDQAYDRHARWACPEAEQFLAQDDRFAYVAQSRPDPNPDLPRQRFIVALDKQTGRRAYQSEHHDFTVFGTNRRDPTIYVGFAGGKLMALQPVLRAGQIGELVLRPMTGAEADTVAMAPAGR